MNNITLTHGEKKFEINVPSKWDECDRKMYFSVCELLRGNNLEQLKLRRFLNVTCKIPKRTIRSITDIEIQALMSTFGWALEPPSHMQTAAGWWFIFRGPKTALYNVTALQYGMTDEAFIKYCEAVKKGEKKESQEKFNKMCACLITPFGLPFNGRIADVQMKFMRFLPQRFKQVVFYEFWGIRNAYVKKFPKTHTKRKSKGSDFGWIGLFVSMAGAEFGKASEVKKERFYEIMVKCEQNFERMKEAEMQQRKKA
jgi:hypothetical protein